MKKVVQRRPLAFQERPGAWNANGLNLTWLRMRVLFLRLLFSEGVVPGRGQGETLLSSAAYFNRQKVS